MSSVDPNTCAIYITTHMERQITTGEVREWDTGSTEESSNVSVIFSS